MRDNADAKTLARNYARKWRFLIREYELVKAKRHPKFKFAGDFYRFHNTHRQTFLKYYHRFAASGDDAALLPRRRGPRWKRRRVHGYIEQQVIAERQRGNNRYDIYAILRPKLGRLTPSPSTIYRIMRDNHINRLKPKMRANRRRIIKQSPGQLAHIDCHHLSRDLIAGDTKRRYLVCVLDDYTRIAWAKIVDDLKAVSVMFATLELLNHLNARYTIRFAEALTDNGPEFASKHNTAHHPFERMLTELGIKHRYTRPYRPQTNGKVERWWRTLNENLIDDATFDSIADFEHELAQYLLYYNEHRPHQALGGKTPKQINDTCQQPPAKLSAN